MIFYLGYTCLFVLYLMYIQFSPGMGNIWYRNDEYFSPIGAVKMILAPFYVKELWRPEFWDINFIVWSLFYISAYFWYCSKYTIYLYERIF
jgi:hypothetical protein